MFVGHHIEKEEEPTFQSARLRLSYLDGWVGRHLVENYGHTGPVPRGPAYSLEFTPPPAESATFSRGNITVSVVWTNKESTEHRAVFETWPVIDLDYPAPQPLRVIQEDVSHLQSLVSMCVDTPAIVDGLTFFRPDVRVKMLNGTEADTPQPIEFLAPPLRYVAPEERKPRHHHQMLLTYEELGGVEAVARWLDVSARFVKPLDSAMSIRRAKFMFAENRFMNVVAAAESFHRTTMNAPYLDADSFRALFDTYLAITPEGHQDWLRSKLEHANEQPLRKRMQQLAAAAAPATRPLIGDKGEWAFAVAGVRNDLSHVNADSSPFDGGDLHYLTESVYAVLRVCMLREAGVPIEALARKAGKWPIGWYGDRLQRSITRVRSQLLSQCHVA